MQILIFVPVDFFADKTLYHHHSSIQNIVLIETVLTK